MSHGVTHFEISTCKTMINASLMTHTMCPGEFSVCCPLRLNVISCTGVCIYSAFNKGTRSNTSLKCIADLKWSKSNWQRSLCFNSEGKEVVSLLRTELLFRPKSLRVLKKRKNNCNLRPFHRITQLKFSESLNLRRYLTQIYTDVVWM